MSRKGVRVCVEWLERWVVIHFSLKGDGLVV
jgi:hypothetical protein